MKNNELLVEWIKAIEEGYSGEEYWSALGEELGSLLQPMKEKIIKDRAYTAEVEAQLEKTTREVEFYVEALNSLPNPIFMKDDQTRFIFFNRKYEEVFGMKRQDFLGKRVYDLEYLFQEDREQYQAEDTKMIALESVVNYEVPFVFSDGNVHESLYWSKGFVVPGTAQRGLIGEIVDISMQKDLERNLSSNLEKLREANEIISKASKTDSVTGLFNRHVLKALKNNIVDQQKYKDKQVCFLLADLDFFKSVNDTYGHLVGDEVLIEFAKILKRIVRVDDVCIRYGGEEFLVILPKTSLEESVMIGERICDILRNNPILPDGKAVTVSIGATEYQYNESLDSCLIRVDKALYTAKKSGKDRVVAL